jgi:hypothetical protein
VRNAAAIALLPLFVALLALQTGDSPPAEKRKDEELAARLLRTDSRAPYVHRLTLYDHEGKAIDPADENAKPYSPKMTCGKCHAYAEITCGWHFNSGSSDLAGFGAKDGKPTGATSQPAVQHGRPGEPWILADARLGVQIPISTRGWPGTFTPAQVGLSNWQFTLMFGRHLAGGGLAEPDEKTIAASAEAKRWAISGTLEIDCMVCHAALASGYDAGEIERQIERQNLRWSPTAALGLGIIRGDARGVSNDFDPESPGAVDRPDLTLPKVQYDKARFDGDNRVHFDIVRDPPSERCYHCHSTRYVGAGATPNWHRQPDVHLAAGLSCSDCHRHGIDHVAVRGAPGEELRRSDASVAALSCAGCHLANDPARGKGGGYPAPRPQHVGIPPVHFERLTCTACHSGPWPNDWARKLQTSLSHGLGVSTKERHEDALPEIIEPVFIGKNSWKWVTLGHVSLPESITPARMTWPSYWAKQKPGGLEPIPLEVVTKAAGRSVPRVKGQSYEQANLPLSDEQVTTILGALAGKVGNEGQAVYVHDGDVLKLDENGKLVGRDTKSQAPYLWPLAHDVRPAQQALGVRGCSDCHHTSSRFYFGYAAASQPAVSNPPIEMRQMFGADRGLSHAWAATFTGREAFKWFGWILVGITSLGLLRSGSGTVARVAPVGSAVGGGSNVLAVRGGGWERMASGLLFIGILSQAATSFGAKWLGGSVSGWTLLIHVSLAPLFLIGLTLTALLRAEHCRFGVETPKRLSVTQKILFWIVMPLGLVVAATMLAAMLPLFGTESMRWLIKVHEVSGLLLLIATAVHLIASMPRKLRDSARPVQA